MDIFGQIAENTTRCFNCKQQRVSLVQHVFFVKIKFENKKRNIVLKCKIFTVDWPQRRQSQQYRKLKTLKTKDEEKMSFGTIDA